MTFMCDPKKNTECRSPLCFEHGGPCGATDRPEYAVRDLFGRPVQLIENEDGGEPCSNSKTARSSRG